MRNAAAGLTLALAVAGCATSRGAQHGRATVDQPMPDVELRDLSGATTRLSAFRGKVVLLDLWATWCAPCKQEMPVLQDIAARLGPEGVEILAVSLDQERENIERFLGPRERWRLRVYHDPTGDIAQALEPPVMPTSYVVDRRGVLRRVNLGFTPDDAAHIEELLRELARQAP